MFHVSPLRPSPFDSTRFGIKVCRASYERVDQDAVLCELIQSEADVAIYRIPSSGSAGIHRLQDHGFDIIDAGTQVYYTMDLRLHEPKPLRNNDVEISLAQAADDPELELLATAAFEGYVSHYSANPLFAPEKVLAGYVEWTLRHRQQPGRTITWVARRAGRIIAFACCEFDEPGRICNGGIYGVLPGKASRGLFGDLIRFTQRYFRELGYTEMRMSTKVGNFAVQKVWIREGYHLYEAYDTFHVNALLSAGHGGSTSFPVRFTRDRLAAVLPTTTDGTASNATMSAQDPPPDAGGFLLSPEISRQIRACHPNADMMIAKASQLFLRPIRHDHEYTLSIRFPCSPSADGHELAVALLRDEGGRLCVLDYHHLRVLPSGQTGHPA